MTLDTRSDSARLTQLVGTWHQAAADAVALLRSLDPEEWALPTDLPGWDVRAVACHLAHLESELAGNPQQQVEVPPAPHVHGLMGQFTESGVLARASWTPAQVVDELETSVATRYAALTADPPSLADPAPGFATVAGWSWETLLGNRCVDLWMHEQDVRRATGRPGGWDTPAATHTADTFARSLPYVLGKKVGAPPGTAVVLEIGGLQARVLAAEVGEDGRATPTAGSAEQPACTVVLDSETWIGLCGGRRAPAECTARVLGDEGLGRRVIENLAVTP